MKMHKLFYRVLTVVILCAMLLPWSGGSLSGTAQAACPVAGGWQERADSAPAGSIVGNRGVSERPSLAAAPDGTLYVAWNDNSSGSYEIYVQRWNGVFWEEVGAGSASGGGISNGGSSYGPSVAVAPDGTPYVAWYDGGNWDYEIYVRRWNGRNWEEVGAGSASGGGVSNNEGYSESPSLAMALDGTPYVAWQDDSSGDLEIYVRRWNGNSWEELGVGSARGGGISRNSGSSRDPSLAVAPDGTPYVAWEDGSSGDLEIYVRRWNGKRWEEVGTGSAGGGGISNCGDSYSWISPSPSLAMAPDGTPYVAWHCFGEIYVRRWSGNSWEEVGTGSAGGGGISDNEYASENPSLAVAPDGTLYVAWEDNSGDEGYAIYMRRWNGKSWEEVGAGSASAQGISGSADYSGNPSLAVAPDGTPYVAWYDGYYGNYEVYVRCWDGSSWEKTGVDSVSGGGISDNSGYSGNPSVAVAPDGIPYVAWDDAGIYVRRWNGSSWEEVGAGSASGGGISNSGESGDPSLAVAPDGTPYVAWQNGGKEDSEIYVRRWNGSIWEEVGAGSASGGGISNNRSGSSRSSLAIAPDGTPYVAWNDQSSGDGKIYVRRWNGSSWEEVGAGSASGGGISDNKDYSGSPSLAIAPDSTPYIAWSDASGGDSEIYVRRWNGSSWEEVGASSASGGGISDNSGSSGSPSLAIAPAGTPYVAWDDDSGGDGEIYVRCWNGSSWEEVGAGSASGGGISDNKDHSGFPSLAIAPDGAPYVAWDNGSGAYGIYMRRWNGNSWEEVGTGSASGGGISGSRGLPWDPSLAVAPDGTPYVAWKNYTGRDEEIYVRRWNGSSWEEVGAGSANSGGINGDIHWSRYPSLAFAPGETLYIAWYDSSSSAIRATAIYMRRWNGRSWGEVGAGSASSERGIISGYSSRYLGSLSTALDGTLYVVLGDDVNWEIYVWRWNGSSWEEMGNSLTWGRGISDNSGESYAPSLAVAPDGTPYVAWENDSDGNSEVYVRRWNGNSWEEVGAGSASGGGISDNKDYSGSPSLAIAPDGTPYVAWGDGSSGGSEIYVRRWNGSNWEEVGAGSASGGGISDNSGSSGNPSLAIAPDGTPYVAWQDKSSGDSEIYVRRWNGSSWEEVGAGSASGGGISDDSGNSLHPSLAIAPDGTPYVAWDDDTGTGSGQIYLWRLGERRGRLRW